METHKLDDVVSVSQQLALHEIGNAAERGFAAIINNRPDDEEPGQPTSAEVEAAAGKAGLEYRYVPLISGQLNNGVVDAFREAMSELPGPILAFCRSGTRSSMLWAAAKAPELGVDKVIETAANAGYDLSAARAFFASQAG